MTNELPFLAGYLLIASTALALAQGDLDSVGGVVVGVAPFAVLLGIMLIIRRALRADAALHNPTPARRSWRRILMAPLPAFRRDVVRVRDLSYGEGARRNLDVYHRQVRLPSMWRSPPHPPHQGVEPHGMRGRRYSGSDNYVRHIGAADRQMARLRGVSSRSIRRVRGGARSRPRSAQLRPRVDGAG